MTAVQTNLKVTHLQETFESSVNREDSDLVKYMQSSFMRPEVSGQPSLHQKTIDLPFYRKLLISKDITPQELLLHFVNLSAIFTKIETLIKTSEVFQDIIGEDLFRYSEVEKDIKFFIDNYSLKRPLITPETSKFLDFIDETNESNKNLMIAVLYVQYSGLFLGRVVCNGTIDFLKKTISNWKDLPPDMNGISYWKFGNLEANALEERKKTLLEKISFHGAAVNYRESLKHIAKKAFEYNHESIKSVVPNSRLIQLQQKNNSHDIFKVALAGCFMLIACLYMFRS